MMNRIIPCILLFFAAACTSGPKESVYTANLTSQSGSAENKDAANADDSEGTLHFKDQLCYKNMDELGNVSEFEILYQPETGIMYVTMAEAIPMIDGVLIYPDATYKILGMNEQGKRHSTIYENQKDIVVELKDEEQVVYPKDYPYVDYTLQDGHAFVYRDGIKGSKESIKSDLYMITFERTGDYMNLYVTDAFPRLNARLMYGLAMLPGDVGEYFKRFSELWNISEEQWPTLVSGKNYSVEMTCYGATSYYVNPNDYSPIIN